MKEMQEFEQVERWDIFPDLDENGEFFAERSGARKFRHPKAFETVLAKDYDALLAYTKGLAAARASEGGWIEIKEELPPTGVTLMLWFQSITNPHGKGLVLGSFPAWEDEENKGKYWDTVGMYREKELITHWQPLPSSPLSVDTPEVQK